MDRLVYVAMSGAKQLMQAQTLVSHNLANANTHGFRADLARFQASPVEGAGYQSRVNAVATGAGFDNSAGALINTGRTLDVAIDGDGWLAVQSNDGTEAYTRAGAFSINGLGLLETRRGELVLGDNGPISIPPHTQLVVGGDGTLSVVPQGQGPETLAQIGRIKLVNPEQSLVQKRADGLVEMAGDAIADADASVKLISGFLESSNVNIAEAMVSMIELARQFEVEVKMMRVADENAARAADLVRLS